ncbi:delta12-fatty acid desaturase [Auriculariales sp. MPI-PUGE-AT-0066]|nr:delta12-fatty acid desaturase [Auriculariales sp. MPI-PUGE-AT-0066]
MRHPANAYSSKGSHKDEVPITTVKQVDFVVPSLTIKDLLSAIPAHCAERSALRSCTYVVWDFTLLCVIYTVTIKAEAWIAPSSRNIEYPHPAPYILLWVALWALYSFVSGLVLTGLWVIGHDCGHQAFSESKFINDSVGWLSTPRESLCHSCHLPTANDRRSLGTPYHSWRISHAKHHASTGNIDQDIVFVPKTRTELGLPPLDAFAESLEGSAISEKVKAELWDAIGDSPIAAIIGSASYLLLGWHSYLIQGTSGAPRHISGGMNHFIPRPPLFMPNQTRDVLVSDIGVLLWALALWYWASIRGFGEVMRVYGFGYLWVNHTIVLTTFLHHTDPLLPHYRQHAYTFARGALTTFDRDLFGDLGSVAAWLVAAATHNVTNTHVLHHVSSRIPHYHAVEASQTLKKRLVEAGLVLQGGNAGWSEMYRVYKECKFVEDEGSVVFYKNAHGLAAARPILRDS